YPEVNRALHAQIESFLMFIWDIGLHIGHSVRTFQDCKHTAKEDLSTYTNLLDARLITGEIAILQTLMQQMQDPPLWLAKDFCYAKLEEQNQRHKKYQETVYWLEPNIKNGPGGLRDIHTIHWISKYFNLFYPHKNLKLLNQDEELHLLQAQNLLWKIRY